MRAGGGAAHRVKADRWWGAFLPLRQGAGSCHDVEEPAADPGACARTMRFQQRVPPSPFLPPSSMTGGAWDSRLGLTCCRIPWGPGQKLIFGSAARRLAPMPERTRLS